MRRQLGAMDPLAPKPAAWQCCAEDGGMAVMRAREQASIGQLLAALEAADVATCAGLVKGVGDFMSDAALL